MPRRRAAPHPVAAPRVTPLSELDGARLRAHRDRHPRGRPRARRRARARIARAARRRAGHRQVDAGAGRCAARRARHGLARGRVLYASGEESRGPAAPARRPLGLAGGSVAERDRRASPRPSVDAIVAAAEATRAGTAGRRLDPDADDRRARRPRRIGRPGARGRGAAAGATPRSTASRRAGRPRDQGRHAGRAQDARAPRRRRADARGRALLRRCDCCARAKNRFGSTEEVGVFEMAADGLREVADPGAAFIETESLGAPGRRRCGHARRAAGRCSSRSRRSSRRRSMDRRGAPLPVSTRSAWRCSSRSSAVVRA